MGHQDLQEVGHGLGGDLHRGVGVAQADHAVEHQGVEEVDQVSQGYRLQIGVEQTLVRDEVGVEEDDQEQDVPDNPEDADDGVDTTVDHGVYDRVLISSDMGDEVHGYNDYSALSA